MMRVGVEAAEKCSNPPIRELERVKWRRKRTRFQQTPGTANGEK